MPDYNIRSPIARGWHQLFRRDYGYVCYTEYK